jgi:hypothetical protein
LPDVKHALFTRATGIKKQGGIRVKLLDPGRRAYTHLFLITFFFCLLINSGSLNSIDALNRLQVTHWIWRHAPQVLNVTNAAGYSAVGRFGQRYVTWGIGQSLVMLPADIVATFLIKAGHLQRLAPVLDSGLVSYATFPLLNSISICLACGVLRELNFSARDSILGALAVLFGTTFMVYAQAQQENSLMLFCLLLGVWGNLRWLRLGQWRYFLLGVCAVGYGLLVRLPSIFDAAAIYFFVIGSFIIRKQQDNKPFASYAGSLAVYTGLFALIYAPFIAADRIYQWLRFDSLTTTYTSIWGAQSRAADPTLPASYPFNAPFSQGFFGQLFSPDRSIFLFNPLIILTVILLVRFWKVLDAQLRLWFFIAAFLLIADIALYSKWFEWGGAGSWGPRYALVPSEYLSLIGVPIFLKFQSTIKSAVEKIIYMVLIAVSIFIQLLSVLFDYNLELTQQANLHTKYVIIWQRAVNTWEIATGSFKSSALMPNVPAPILQKWTSLAFMPWRTEGELPARLSDILQILWLIAAALFLAYILIFIRRLRNRLAD